MLDQVEYERVEAQGLRILHGGVSKFLEVDHIVVCAGQMPYNPLQAPLEAMGISYHVIGGAFKAMELDAKFAIEQGYRLGLAL